jgi:hypothetical protein
VCRSTVLEVVRYAVAFDVAAGVEFASNLRGHVFGPMLKGFKGDDPPGSLNWPDSKSAMTA